MPSRVANGDLCVTGRCDSVAGSDDLAAGATEPGARVIECAAGVTERGAGVANGKPLREDGGALKPPGDVDNLTLGKVELRVGIGRGRC